VPDEEDLRRELLDRLGEFRLGTRQIPRRIIMHPLDFERLWGARDLPGVQLRVQGIPVVVSPSVARGPAIFEYDPVEPNYEMPLRAQYRLPLGAAQRMLPLVMEDDVPAKPPPKEPEPIKSLYDQLIEDD
jgi:hypothetical protein